METKTVKLYSLDYSNARTYLMGHCPKFCVNGNRIQL